MALAMLERASIITAGSVLVVEPDAGRVSLAIRNGAKIRSFLDDGPVSVDAICQVPVKHPAAQPIACLNHVLREAFAFEGVRKNTG